MAKTVVQRTIPTPFHRRAFVVKAASLAVTRDASSGGCVRTVTINAQGTKRDFITNPNIPLYYGDAAPLRVAA